MLLEILTDPWAFLAYTLIAYVCLFIVFVRLIPLRAAQWKRADYIWLTTAILGVLPAVLLGRENYSTVIAEQTLNYAHADYDFARQLAAFNATYHCRKSVRSDHPPDNFDEVTAAFQEACNNSRTLLQGFPSWNQQSPPNMGRLISALPSYAQPILNDDIAALRKALQNYESQRKLMLGARRDAQPSRLRDLLTFLSPLLLGFAIALRLVKIEGEIRTQKQ